ncbi:MAG: hypothetical protein QXK12_07700 [Candidatus Nezhaarchaeales archaeon]
MDVASTGLDEEYTPPFPWCAVILTDPFKRKIISAKGYIDTGSDGSIVPAKTGRELNLLRYPLMRVEVCGIGGKQEDRILYAAYMKINDVEVATAVDVREDVDIVLLGRDVLQHVKITLDWKRKKVEVADPKDKPAHESSVKRC